MTCIQSLNETLDALKDTNVRIESKIFDVTDKAALESSIEDCIEKFGKLNILVIAAGFASQTESDIDKWDMTIDVNLKAAMRLVKFCLPHLEKTSREGERASIINVSSISSIIKVPFLAPYVASKHGIHGFIGSIFEHVRKKGIKVCSIMPGWVDTKMLDPLAGFINREKCITPEQVAHTAHFIATFPESGCPNEILLSPQYHN